jgi:nicotinamidase-related amidase
LVNRVPGGEVLYTDIVPRRELCDWLPGGYTHEDLILEAKAYCQTLQDGGRYNLYLWPLHCLKGTPGQALSAVIEEVWMYHTLVHGTQGHIESKSVEPLSERYSAFSSEVMWGRSGRKIGSRSEDLLSRIQKWQALIVLGQAGSHCVRSSVDDLIRHLLATNPEFISRIYIVVDCMSSVVVPGVVDYTPQFEESLVRWQAAGCKLVLSTDAMESWPSMREILAA